MKKMKKYNKRRYSAGMFYTSSAGAVTSLILIIVLFSIFSFAGATNTHATTSTITISTIDNISLSISPKSSLGTFATSDTTTPNISVKTNNGTGYTLGIKASVSNSNALSTIEGDTIPSITSSVSEDNYNDDSYASTHNLNDTWGYRLSKLYSSDNSFYRRAPTSTTSATTLDRTSVANPTTANAYNIAIGARLTYATVMGTYSNTFMITVVANPAVYSITYDQNTTDTVTNMPSNISNRTTSNEAVTLANNIPARDGYGFKGWCTVQVADGADCAGTPYPASSTWTLDQTQAANSLYLYAMWEEFPILYDLVASMVKTDSNGDPLTQSLSDMQAAITKPTSNDPTTDTSNSGVYLYDSANFGTASDASNDYDIYYYRGILDSDLDDTDFYSYGSNGDGLYYPNYVKLNNDTCWRIVRTTGSGGVKMIYNGKYSTGTKTNSCANATNKTSASTETYGIPFNRGSSSSSDNYGTKGFAVYVGYNYNSTYAYNHTSYTSAIPNSELFINETPSNLRIELENWYANNMTSYTDRLESSAGWCNDRSTSTDSTIPYALKTRITFGAYRRNRTQGNKLSLSCPNLTGNDLLTASNGITYPAAPLTADEAALSGNGRGSSFSSNYSYSSFLNAGESSWLLSPGYRQSNATPGTIYACIGGGRYMDCESSVHNSNHLRPSISFKYGTKPSGGSGTAADPWVINP